MSKKILISGGCERKNGFELGEGKYYDRARLLRLSLDNGAVEVVFEKTDGDPPAYPSEHPNLQFTAACVTDEHIWLPTDTEIYQLTYPELDIVRVISHPFFHNIHSVHIIDQQLIVTSTGLDLVAFLTLEGEIVKLVNTEGKPLWHRFDERTDYRQVHSTRPHACHPNYVFKHNGDYWVTRCRQQDAVNLADVSQCIPVTDPSYRVSVHDGHVWNDQLLFTTVDGAIVIIDPESRQIIESIDLIKAMGSDKLGWARGLYIDDEDIAYLAFSRLRRTRLKEKLSWAARGEIKKMSGMPACIVAFDLRKRVVVGKYDIPFKFIDAIYNVVGEPCARRSN